MTSEQIILQLQQEYARRREDNLHLFEEHQAIPIKRFNNVRIIPYDVEISAGIASEKKEPKFLIISFPSPTICSTN